MELNLAQINSFLTIQKIQGDSNIVTRLYEIGLCEGSKIQIIQKTPFSGPLIIQHESSIFALRIEEAKCLIVQ